MAVKIVVDLTSPEHSQNSKMGEALHSLFYHSKNEDLLDTIDHVGCPNSGGSHNLVISGSRPDVMTWLELFLEQFPDIEPEIKEIRRLIMKESLGAFNFYKVNLKDIKREFKHKGKTISRPWFWKDYQE